MLALSCPADCRWGANADKCHGSCKKKKKTAKRLSPAPLPWLPASRQSGVERTTLWLIPVQTTDWKRTWSHPGMTGLSTAGRESCFQSQGKYFFVGPIFIGLKTCGYLWETRVPVMIRRCQHPSTIKRQKSTSWTKRVSSLSTGLCWCLLVSHG